MAEPLPPQYNPQETEGDLYRWWEEQGFFHADERSGKETYVIPIPPPNVTAALHMGHGLNNSIQDTLVRWRRMQGIEALWIPGSDHAGIATQNVVERLLAKEGKTRFDLGREPFVERIWSFVRETGGTIYDQLRAMGCSLDWPRARFTLDDGLSLAVREVFVRLHEKGLVYRGNRIIHWCPRCLTALSDEEAEPKETQGKLWHLRYPLAEGADGTGLPRLPDGRAYLVVATTRPETMLGDTAVGVHPNDERYTALVGGELDLPLTGRRIPVVADEYVDPEFGSGAVKLTPAHDPNDFAVAERTGVPALDVMTPEATMSDNAPEAFRGMDRFEARRAVVQAFSELGLLEKTEEHTHAVPHCYRCDTVVEPRLSLQWWVRMEPLAKPALQAWRDGEVRFTPERFGKIYEHWLENIRDWCISRQLWWGHRIPVWYCRAEGCEEVIVAREDPASCPKCGAASPEQDPDVLDTWFSSWLWPFSTLGWPEETADLKAFYPNSTLVSGQDIIFFWIARMIMGGIEFRGEVPFRDVYLTGMVRDHLGRKMSKSLGNGIDPLEVVRRFGADALRYTVLTGAGPGMDQYLNYQDLEEAFGPGRNFANKLWNAGRFALMNLGDGRVGLDDVRGDLELADRWILSRASKATREVTDALERFRFQDAGLAAYGFFWGDLADWYLEAAKPRLYGDMGEASQRAAQAVLATALETALLLLHPMMPFITEAVWRKLPRAEGDAASLMVSRWPEPRPEWEDAEAEALFAEVQEVIGAVRNIRSEYGIQPGARVPLRAVPASERVGAALEASRRTLRDLARVEELSFGAGNGEVGASAVLRSGTELFVPLAGVIDVEKEISRLRGEVARVDGLLVGTEKKLQNESFVSRAPAEVVEKEREKLASFREQREKLADKLAALEGAS